MIEIYNNLRVIALGVFFNIFIEKESKYLQRLLV
jgi:hypothetical protein